MHKADFSNIKTQKKFSRVLFAIYLNLLQTFLKSYVFVLPFASSTEINDFND